MPAPTPQFFAQLNRAFQAPVIMAMTGARADQFKARLFAAAEATDLTPADRQILDQAEQEIRQGLSVTLQDPVNWGGDWAAEDEAADTAGVEEKSLRQDDGDDTWVGLGG